MKRSIMLILAGMVCAGTLSAGERSKPPPGIAPAPPKPGTPPSAMAPAYESKSKEFAEKATKAKEEGKADEAKAYQGISEACAKLSEGMKNNDHQAMEKAATMLGEARENLKKSGVKLEGFLGGPMPGGAPHPATPAPNSDDKEVKQE